MTENSPNEDTNLEESGNKASASRNGCITIIFAAATYAGTAIAALNWQIFSNVVTSYITSLITSLNARNIHERITHLGKTKPYLLSRVFLLFGIACGVLILAGADRAAQTIPLSQPPEKDSTFQSFLRKWLDEIPGEGLNQDTTFRFAFQDPAYERAASLAEEEGYGQRELDELMIKEICDTNKGSRQVSEILRFSDYFKFPVQTQTRWISACILGSYETIESFEPMDPSIGRSPLARLVHSSSRQDLIEQYLSGTECDPVLKQKYYSLSEQEIRSGSPREGLPFGSSEALELIDLACRPKACEQVFSDSFVWNAAKNSTDPSGLRGLLKDKFPDPEEEKCDLNLTSIESSICWQAVSIPPIIRETIENFCQIPKTPYPIETPSEQIITVDFCEEEPEECSSLIQEIITKTGMDLKKALLGSIPAVSTDPPETWILIAEPSEKHISVGSVLSKIKKRARRGEGQDPRVTYVVVQDVIGRDNDILIPRGTEISLMVLDISHCSIRKKNCALSLQGDYVLGNKGIRFTAKGQKHFEGSESALTRIEFQISHSLVSE